MKYQNYYIGAGISINPTNAYANLPLVNGYFVDFGTRVKPIKSSSQLQVVFELSPYINRAFSSGNLRTSLGVAWNFEHKKDKRKVQQTEGTFCKKIKNMKCIFQFIFLLTTCQCFAQPTGHQRIFLEITDIGVTLHFENNFKKNELSSKPNLKYKNYQLSDISKNKTGFAYYYENGFIHKTLMTDDHQIQIVRNGIDTMQIEILNAFDVYFLSIPFQKGIFRMVVNDGKENQWYANTLPYKPMNTNSNVYNLTPIDWSVFKVGSDKIQQDYFISVQFEKQQLLAKPVLPEEDPNFKNPRRINTLRIETADYNFDGQKDYREHKLNNPKEWNYFLYKDSIMGYVLDSLMSNLNITKFDFEKKTFEVTKSGKRNDEFSQTDTYEFVLGKARLVSKKPPVDASMKDAQKDIEEKITSIQTYLIKPFKFVLEKNTPGIAIPTEKGYYANKISVYNNTEKPIYSMVAVGNKLRESEGCRDSLQIADYNFDGFPDFRVCNNSVPGKHTYYIYHQKRNTFLIEYTLTELKGLNFDFENKTAKGSTERKEFAAYPWNSRFQYYMEALQFEGIGLENLTVTTTVYGSSSYTSAKCKYINQKRIYEGDTIGLELQKKKLLTKEVGPFKFEIEFNPEEVKTSGEKGSYVKVLNIFKGERSVGNFEMHGNYLNEVPHWLDSMEIADFNFDGYPDIRIYNSQLANGRYVYLLYNSEKEVQAFYQDTYFSLLMESEFNPEQKIMKGKILEATQTIYFFLKNDTLTLTTQDKDLSKKPFIEESIYKNGNRKSLRSAYGKLEPEVKKEFGDYNFDGYEDFRQQSKKSPYYYDVFIYNTQKQTFEKDTLLSKFEVFNYNKHEKKLDGYHRIRTNETTWQTKYYQWSFTEMKMVLYQEQVCYSKYPMGESQRCVISKLVNGKWIDTETFGAE